MKDLFCQECDRVFSSKESLHDHNLAKHMSKEERMSHLKKKHSHSKKSEKSKELLSYIFIGLFVIGILYGLYVVMNGETFSDGEIHWHADLTITICGEDYALPEADPTKIAHGEPYAGTSLVHIHTGNTIHVEGTVQEVEDISLNKILEVFEITFTDTQIVDSSNGDLCPDGSEGTVQLLVNGIPSGELSGKSLVDDDEYEIIFS
jgi:hypothetical protein